MNPVVVEVLSPFHDVDVGQVNRLLLEVFPERTPATPEEVAETLRQPYGYTLLARIGQEYVGLCICLMQPCMGRFVTSIHEFSVRKDVQGMGIGKLLISRLHQELQSFCNRTGKTVQPYASSNPTRKASNAVMLQAGMTRIAEASDGPMGSNFYKMIFRPTP